MSSAKNSTCPTVDTLAGLLDAISGALRKEGVLTSKQIVAEFRKLKTAAVHFARFLGKSVSEAPTSGLAEKQEPFVLYLKTLNLTECVISRHKCAVRRLLDHAMDLGSSPETFALVRDWRRFMHGAGNGVSGLAQYAVRNEIPTSRLSQRHLDVWQQEMREKGRSPSTIVQLEYKFRSFVKRNGLQMQFPLLAFDERQRPSFRLRRENMHPALAAEITSIDQWLKAGNLPITRQWQEQIVHGFEDLCGYAVHVRKMNNATTLERLLRKNFIRSYAHWLSVARRYSHKTIRCRLSCIRTVARWHPLFDRQECGWIGSIAAEIPKEPESKREDRRDAGKLSYPRLAEIPGKIRARRLALGSGNPEKTARLMHDEVLMAALIVAVWPAEFVVSATLLGSTPTIFKAPVDPTAAGIAIDDAAARAVAENPEVPLWQFSYTRDGRRSYHARGLVLSSVAPVLEDYIENYRPLLVHGADTGSVFFDRRGHPIDQDALLNAVKRISQEYASKAVTPRSIRLSFADYYLDRFPGHYERLANILWLTFASARLMFDPDFRWNRHEPLAA